MAGARLLAQFGVLLFVMGATTLISNQPVFHALAPDTAVLTMSFSHGADRRAACRQLTAEEIAELPPNMRRTEICPRRRPPLFVELRVDGVPLFAADLPPSGIAGDGPSRVHEQFRLAAGEHDIEVGMRDNPTTEGFDYTAARHVSLVPAQHAVIDFQAVAGGFVFSSDRLERRAGAAQANRE
jgi:hypothetical protein